MTLINSENFINYSVTIYEILINDLEQTFKIHISFFKNTSEYKMTEYESIHSHYIQ